MNTRECKGFSVLEIILAVGIFVVMVSGMVIAVLSGMETNRLGQEETVATEYTTEGIEAARSIRNLNFSALNDTSGTGIDQVSGVWSFSGNENVLDGKYTRVISIESVRRDGSGNIVESGGGIDPDTKKVTVTTSWAISSSRYDSVVLMTYLTNWKAPI